MERMNRKKRKKTKELRERASGVIFGITGTVSEELLQMGGGGGRPKAKRQVRNKENKTKEVSFLQTRHWQHSKILLQSTDTGARSPAGRTDVEGLRSIPNPSLSLPLPPTFIIHVSVAWPCRIGFHPAACSSSIPQYRLQDSRIT